MHVITRKRLNEFAEKHPDAKSSLARWYAIVRKGRFLNFAQLRETFPHADQVGKFTAFNIGGNKVRLIAAVHYNRNKIYIRHVLTHQEYDAGKWKNNMSVAELEKVTKAWPPISRAVRVPHTDADYRDLVELLDRVTDEVGEDENHPLASLMDVLGVLIEKYEDEHVPELTE
jgi:mRNA interferase HigB